MTFVSKEGFWDPKHLRTISTTSRQHHDRSSLLSPWKLQHHLNPLEWLRLCLYVNRATFLQSSGFCMSVSKKGSKRPSPKTTPNRPKTTQNRPKMVFNYVRINSVQNDPKTTIRPTLRDRPPASDFSPPTLPQSRPVPGLPSHPPQQQSTASRALLTVSSGFQNPQQAKNSRFW